MYSKIAPQAVAQTDDDENLPHVVAKLDSDENNPQLVDELCSIPWGHHRYIIDKCKGNTEKALFYVRKTIDNNWSRAVLLNWLDTDLYERQGKAITNFDKQLPVAQGDLANELTKDPYNFDFLTMTEGYNETEIHQLWREVCYNTTFRENRLFSTEKEQKASYFLQKARIERVPIPCSCSFDSGMPSSEKTISLPQGLEISSMSCGL